MKLFLKVVLAVLILGPAHSAFAQEDFEDLRILYMDGDYEKLIKKAERYAEKEDTRKSADPYLYLSKAYYEISKSEEYSEDYPPDKAFRDALKWAKKYRRKDAEGALFAENDLYFRELKESALREAGGQMAEEKYSRARRYYDAISDFDPDDPGAWLMLAYCQMKERNVRESEMSYTEAGKVLHNTDVSKLNSVERRLLLEGVLNYSDYLVKEGKRDSARATLNLAAPALEGDNEFDMALREIN